jgi:hypothetical protein
LAESAYIIGIDLGTTNSVVAYTETDVPKGRTPQIRVLPIPQLVEAGTVEKRDMLPSFLFLPGPHDVSEGGLDLPWKSGNEMAVGEFARERGAELPQRLISSSKSWLCHTLVDRNKAILPWDGPEEMEKLSPVEAAARILGHIRDAWDSAMAEEDPDLRMEHQDVLLTVPASFDAVARELTVKAAEMAGLGQITLLEEPQAAFYAWIEAAGDAWREEVQKGDLVLVCDVGGGTSDFSLINVSEEEGDLVLDRIAVGDHLLVGGDNMDLALAYQVSEELRRSKGKKLDAWQMRGLWHACRKAKEALLSDGDAKVHPVTILGRGSSLIGGTTKTDVEESTAERVVLDGFFPRCEREARPAAPPRTGIRQMGLSYESDPAVTRHLAHFLSRRREAGSDGFGPSGTATSAAPTAILFNGGVMKADRIRERVTEVLGSWQDGDGAREIANRNFDLAVARGAAYYGLARRGTGIRIRGGLNRSYYIGVAASMPAVPGMPMPIKALCVAPFGMEEGTGSSLPDQEFVLVVGEPVKFDFLGSTVRLDDAPGALVDEWEGEIEHITTIETTLDGEAGSAIPVILEVKVTEIGTLELWCVSRENPDRRWKLEFNVREQGAEGI